MLRTLTIACLIIIAFITFNMGMDWINIGHGLHPAIAFPITTVTFIGACVMGQFMEYIHR